MGLRHWLLHLFGLNRCRVVGHLDLECVGCGKVYPASEELKATMRRITDRDIPQAGAGGKEGGG